ncbi:MAG: TIGR03619 family F420-dependent LLM class oxidoreductase, partial [Dehalococcoidia bacterium]
MAELAVCLPAHEELRADTVPTFARRAEELGFHSLWSLDRVVYGNLEPLTALAAAAAVTSRIRLGISVLLAPLRHPVLLAKVLATLDGLSDGRVTLGMGIGSRPNDYAALGVPFGRRGRRAEEMIQVMQQVWLGEPVQHQGEFYSVDVGPVGPRPVQPGGPPLWMGGSAPLVLRRIARLASGFIARGAAGPHGFAESWEQVHQYTREVGRDPASLTPASLAYYHVDADEARARETATSFITHFY